MSDKEENISTEESQFDKPRRNFLKLVLMGSVVAASVAVEIKAGNEGIDTPSGHYSFLYESHDVGVSVEDVPDDSDIFYREVTLGSELFTKSPDEILSSVFVGNESSVSRDREMPFLSSNIIEKLTVNKIQLMIGDVDLRTEDYQVGRIIRAAEFGTSLAVIMLMIAKRLKQSAVITDSVEEMRSISSALPRRTFLYNSLLALGAVWAMSPTISFLLTRIGSNTTEQTALKRVLSRLQGIQSHFHPELASTFFRDAMTANKLLAAGEDYEKNYGRKAKFAVLLNGSHSGVEDLIKLDQKILRAIILSWPQSFLEGVTQYNGGVDSFSSVRIFELAVSETKNGINSDRTMINNERKVTDQILAGELTAILHANN